MKITAFCPTLNRPGLLPRLIACFERQTYQNCELIILDDGGQYENQHGDRWELISVPRRFRSLGEKNNACVALASFDSEGIVKADDDDIYMPWWMESMAEALSRNPFVQPRKAIDFVDGEWVQIETFNRKQPDRFAYHGCWGYRRDFFKEIGGYRAEYAGDDQELDRRVKAKGVRSVGLAEQYQPFYWYNRPLPGRISMRGGNEDAYRRTGAPFTYVPYVGKLPAYAGEEVWNYPVPTKTIQRGW